MVSSETRSRLSGDIFIYHVKRLSSSPFSSSLVHLWKTFSVLGGLLFLRSHWPPMCLCRGDVRPRRPCSAEWTEQPVGFTPKQLSTARRRHHPRELKQGQRLDGTARELQGEASTSAPSYFFFSPQDRTGECAHSVPGVCACVCLPVWITMMQSAAVLSTESPVKSLPEILGVPLQRKTFCTLPFLSDCQPGNR